MKRSISVNVIGHIDKVTLCLARLLLRWVTVCGYTILVFNQANCGWAKGVLVMLMATTREENCEF